MRSLLERAKPELVAALEKQRLEYPGIAAEVTKYLTENYFVVDLRYGTCMDLKSLWLQGTGKMVDSPWEYFEED